MPMNVGDADGIIIICPRRKETMWMISLARESIVIVRIA